ncbi:MAG: Elongation factor 1-beta [Candidatus Methanofastidiosum methylothiophilum]|jgi:elongation factor 1-beta|uniref:Elongation factor 1-beta n=1 Tax=Candidatus Methanofastidiosum methylothiophilum TaxID=1705564 RepID=A0A150J8L0_9EURY|nr:MAG: Elongation factor 1-beta [Candidatus Methanofastidiosum methylthiophilus]KYC56141.1 MAG: Elongation factor 1-beta [Candidatus Methanofastidiosum methylthiophilus]KYC56216.1 MAG: Elongation factor 1-beta [Candidatus Methanofastidiosum methylthiophilus]OQC51224.1 MAG: Elongation factor 1-beta [Euryarchaeota archaeon ADurb.Bin023]
MWGVCWAIGCVFMSDFNLSITAMIMPNSPDVDIGAMKKAIEAAVPSNMKLHKIEEIPIAFGLVSLKVMLLGKDQAGGTDELENNFSSIDNITQVEVTDVRRLVG